MTAPSELVIVRCAVCGIFAPQKLSHGAKIVSMPCAHRADQQVRYVVVDSA